MGLGALNIGVHVMAAETGFLARIGAFVGLMRSPNRTGSPEANIDNGESDNRGPPVGMISRDTEISFIPEAYLNAIKPNDDTILQRDGGALGLQLYDALLDDGTVMSALQQRRLAITSRDYEVAPGDDNDPRSVQAANDFRDMLKAVGWDRVTGAMHYAVHYGYAVAEGLYTTKIHNGRRIVWLDDIVVPNRRWFGFTTAGELRMLTVGGTLGDEPLPPNKFWALRTGASHDFAFYGLGLAHWAYWPVFFKRAALKFWALYLEKYASPTALGGFPSGASDDDKGKLLASLVAIGQDRAVVVPEELVDKVKFMEPTRSGAGVSSYMDFVHEQNDEIDRVYLGQPGTAQAKAQGIGGTQSDTHEGVKSEIVKADSDLISEGVNGTYAKWVTLWNYGPDVAPPKVYRVLDDSEDLNTVAERDGKLDALGWQRTEESFAEVYGEGYERKPEPDPVAIDPVTGKAVPGSPGQAANNNEKIRKAANEFGVDDRAPLYVSRALLGNDLKRWAERNGLKPFVADPHVTVLYSKTPVDWFDMGDSWGNMDGTVVVEPGGPRKIERLGDEGAIVLRFASPYLRYRHDSMVERGASHDYPEYIPHVTLTYDAKDVDIDAIEPFIGELRFGPEIFAPIKEAVEDPDLVEFEARELDAIDRLVAALVDDGSPVFSAMAEAVRDNLQGVTTIEGARVAMLEAMERFPIEKLAKLTALPYLASRAAAVAGKEDAITA